MMNNDTKQVKLKDEDGNIFTMTLTTDKDGKERVSSIVNAAGVTITGGAALVAECVGGLVDVSIKGAGKLSKFFSKDGGFRSGGRDRTSQFTDLFHGKTKKEKLEALQAQIDEIKNSDDS